MDNGFLFFDCQVACRRANSAILIDNPQPVAYVGVVFYSVHPLREAVELRDALRFVSFRTHSRRRHGGDQTISYDLMQGRIVYWLTR